MFFDVRGFLLHHERPRATSEYIFDLTPWQLNGPMKFYLHPEDHTSKEWDPSYLVSVSTLPGIQGYASLLWLIRNDLYREFSLPVEDQNHLPCILPTASQ